MTPPKRSTLKLDLKDLSPRPSAPHLGRIGLVMVSVLALVSTIASINSPSSAAKSALHAKHTDLKQGKVILDDSDVLGHSFVSNEPGVLLASSSRAVANDRESGDVFELDAPVSIFTPEQEALDKIIDVESPIDSVTPSSNKSALTNTELRLAMVSIAIPEKQTNPVINHTESDLETSNIETPDLKTAVENAKAKTNIFADGLLDSTGPVSIANSVQQAVAEPTKLAGIELTKDTNTTETVNKDSVDENKETESDLSATEQSAEPESIPSQQVALNWKTEKVRKNDTLSQIFNRLDLSSREAYALVNIKEAAALNRIRPGQEIKVTTLAAKAKGQQDLLQFLHYKIDQYNTLVITNSDQGYQVLVETREPVLRFRTVKATIWSSLMDTANTEDVPTEVVYSLAAIFGWQVDFAKDIQSGDQFSVIFEEFFLDDKKVGNGDVIAAELITGSKRLRAVRHVDEDNRVSYYAPDGDGIQGSFLRTPLKFGRVTSKFTNKRYHPILKKWRAHKGVDYGAPMKTPILATGDGVVRFAGSKKGYGRTLILRHGGKYETVYAHMNHFKNGVRSGSRVKQGDVIGYVGKTGWTTGPHLHYEFRVNGLHMNPLTVALPKSAPIDDRYRKQFQQQAETWVAQLEEVSRLPLASNNQQ